MTLRLDAVIPTKNRDQRLPRVIEPLLADAAIARVIVVDDAPTSEPTGGRLDPALLSDRVEVIHTGGVGPARARQVGAQASSSEILLFLDDDVVPTAGLPRLHLRHHQRESNLLVCGYTPIAAREGKCLSPEAAAYGATYEKRCVQYDRDPAVVLTHLWGGNFSLPRSTALEVGLDSERFEETWHEDRDFGLRCRRAGVKAVFDREILAHHEYERNWEVLAKESYRRGYSLVVLHDAHPDIGPLDEGYFTEGRPWPLRLFVGIASREPFRPLARGFINALRAVAKKVGWNRLQLISVQLLRLSESAAGARDALAADRGGGRQGA
jgi:glycosyltransferase involved in cell wall biosynthesis